MPEVQTEHDAAVTAWMEKYGWPVDDRHYDVSRELHAWRSHAVRPVVTLWITRSVVEDHSPEELARVLDRLHTSQALSHAPEMYTVVMRSELGPPKLYQEVDLP
jgi:hypothetical protein